MRLKGVVKNVFSVFVLKTEVLYLSEKEIVNLLTNRKVDICAVGNVRRNNDTVASILENKIEIYDSFLNNLTNIEHPEITLESGLPLLDTDNIIIHNFNKSDNLLNFLKGNLISIKHDFLGLILNEKYVLNY